MPAKDDLIILEKRFGLKNVITTGEAASAAREAANEFPDAINKIMEEKRCLPEQVLSADTSSPVLEKMPQRTCISGDETRTPGPKADGQAHGSVQGRTALVYRAAKPWDWESGDKHQVPASGSNTKGTWTRRTRFLGWIHRCLSPEVRRYLARTAFARSDIGQSPWPPRTHEFNTEGV